MGARLSLWIQKVYKERGGPFLYKILIVEDDAVIAHAVAQQVERWGCEALCAADFEHVMQEFASFAPHLVLLDIALPFFSGYHWCAEIRKVSSVPVIFISSAADNMNIVMAVNMGGDDFLAKPFSLEVLTAKVQALLRRTYDFAGPAALLQHRGAMLDVAGATLTYEGRKLDLTKNENRILQVLLENKGKTVSRDTLMTRLWETDSYVDENTLTVNVARLRKKLESAGLEDFIQTQKGVGYKVG